MTLEQRAKALAQKLAPLHEWLHDGTPWHEPGSRLEATVVTALKEVEREALERAAKVSESAYERMFPKPRHRITAENTGYATGRYIRALIDTPASEAPDLRDAQIKRRTVEMPLSDANNLDAVVHALGIEDSETTPAEAVAELKAEIKRLRAVVRTMDEAMESFIQLARVDGLTSHDFKIIDQAKEAALRTLDK